MKKFNKFSAFFSLFVSGLIFIYKMVVFAVATIEYSKETDVITKSLYGQTMQESLISGLIILMIGLAISSIIMLLIKISEKKEIETTSN